MNRPAFESFMISDEDARETPVEAKISALTVFYVCVGRSAPQPAEEERYASFTASVVRALADDPYVDTDNQAVLAQIHAGIHDQLELIRSNVDKS